MLKQNKTSFVISTILAGFLLAGCTNSASDATTQVALTSGQLVDGYVSNVTFECADGTTGTTNVNGSFNCVELPVSFSLGGLSLGSVAAMPADLQIFPQDLLGLSRADTNNTQVTAMARFLQACDSDANPNNGLDVNATVIAGLSAHNGETFDPLMIANYALSAGVTLPNEANATSHLQFTVNFVSEVVKSGLPANIQSILLTPQSELSQNVIDSLTYMGSEEKLAYDIYNALYKLRLKAGSNITPLTKIPKQSEILHITAVMQLLGKYDINTTELSNPVGVYDTPAIQTLYNTLLAHGKGSDVAALEVGCVVEVTDIDNLKKYMTFSKASNATDVTGIYNYLLQGSYAHYWAFDDSLKYLGVVDGCCSLGTVDLTNDNVSNPVNYCQPNFPKKVQ